MKALVGTFNQEKALVGAFSVIVKTGCETNGALHSTKQDQYQGVRGMWGKRALVTSRVPKMREIRRWGKRRQQLDTVTID